MPDPTPLEVARKAVIRKGTGCFVMFDGEIYDDSGMLEALDEFEAQAKAEAVETLQAAITDAMNLLQEAWTAAEARHALTDSSERP